MIKKPIRKIQWTIPVPVIRDDERPWIEVAKEVIAGRHLKGDSMTTAVFIGLRGIPDPICRQAVALIRTIKSFTPPKDSFAPRFD